MDVQVLARSLPSGFCPATYQEILNGFSAHQYVQIDTTSLTLVVSATKPTDTGVAWMQLDQFGRPVRIYIFAQGAWLSLHPQPSGFVMPWFDALPTFTTFDGGDANALSAISGPMWERITTLDAKFPLTAGTLPSGTVVAQGGTGGEEKHALTVPELPAHNHTGDSGFTTGDDDGAGERLTSGQNTGNDRPAVNLVIDNTGDDEPHNNMPPYVGMAWLRRTSRMFYVVP